MSTRTDSNSTLLIALILIFTFPLWFGLGIGLFGVIIGLLGAAIGIIAAFFGVIVSIIAIPFKILFGFGHWGWDSGHDFFPHFHHGSRFLAVVVIIIAAIIISKRKRA